MRYFELDKNSYSRYLGRNVVFCVELSHPNWNEVYRLVNDTKAVTIDGVEYQPFPFDLKLTSQKEQQGTQIVFSNVNNLASNLIRDIVNSNDSIIVQLYIANIESNTAERYDKGEFELFNPSITPEQVSATLNLRHCFDVNCGSIRYNKQLFPNLFL
jgi:phage-related protein